MKIVVASGICVERDAISNAMVEQARILRTIADVDDLCLVAQHVDRACEFDRFIAPDSWAFLRCPAVADADLVILHWGIAYQTFDSLPLLAAEQRVVVHFHNQTPLDLASEDERSKVQQGLEQIELIGFSGAPVWTESRYNIETLTAHGVPSERVSFMPFPIEPPRPLLPADRVDELRLLTVGRIVPAKGLSTLVDALAIAERQTERPVRLIVAGNSTLSDPTFLDVTRRQITDLGLTDRVDIVLDIDDEQLWGLYEWAEVVVSPSLHEGLCVPIIEGYIAGCRAIGTDAGNLPYVVRPPDPVVPAGDASALAAAIVAVAAGPPFDPADVADLVETYSRSSTRRCLDAALDGWRATGGATARRA